jgi:hypothetical protein
MFNEGGGSKGLLGLLFWVVFSTLGISVEYYSVASQRPVGTSPVPSVQNPWVALGQAAWLQKEAKLVVREKP